jgi:hypothetical protein
MISGSLAGGKIITGPDGNGTRPWPAGHAAGGWRQPGNALKTGVPGGGTGCAVGRVPLLGEPQTRETKCPAQGAAPLAHWHATDRVGLAREHIHEYQYVWERRWMR